MKKTIILAVIIIAAALLFVLMQVNNKTTYKETKINWISFQEKSTKENTVVIDIRTADEYNAGKLFSDALVDYDFYQNDFEQKVSKLDKNKTYLIYCRSGNRTSQAISIFEKYGLEVYDLDGGHKSTPFGSLK